MTPIEAVAVTASGWIVAALTLFKWLHELREKRREKSAKEAAQAELRQLQRRSLELAPYYVANGMRFNSAIGRWPDGKEYHLFPGEPSLLCFQRDEVDPNQMEEGDEVVLLIINQGEDAVEVRPRIDGEPVYFIPIEGERGQKTAGLLYKYNPAIHQKQQELEVSFLARNGVRDTHRYKILHGVRGIQRTDPV